MKQFNSKYNIGQDVAQGIYIDLTQAFGKAEKGSFDLAFTKFKTIKSKIPSEKIKKSSKKAFGLLDKFYLEAVAKKNNKKKYRIIMKYSEILINELDNNNMYLPSLKDMSQFV